MPKAVCDYAKSKDNYIYCTLAGYECGHQKFCRQENRWKLNDTCINCQLPKKYKK